MRLLSFEFKGLTRSITGEDPAAICNTANHRVAVLRKLGVLATTQALERVGERPGGWEVGRRTRPTDKPADHCEWRSQASHTKLLGAPPPVDADSLPLLGHCAPSVSAPLSGIFLASLLDSQYGYLRRAATSTAFDSKGGMISRPGTHALRVMIVRSLY